LLAERGRFCEDFTMLGYTLAIPAAIVALDIRQRLIGPVVRASFGLASSSIDAPQRDQPS
jgi:hypothetical protein